jgi:hypothetical protein
MALAADSFKGSANLSPLNDFNQQWPETARIATLSQQMALMLEKGPRQIGLVFAITPPPCFDRAAGGYRAGDPSRALAHWLVFAITPHHASTGRQGCGATSQSKTKLHNTFVINMRE